MYRYIIKQNVLVYYGQLEGNMTLDMNDKFFNHCRGVIWQDCFMESLEIVAFNP